MKRTFSLYGPVDTNINYYTPQTELFDRIKNQLAEKDFNNLAQENILKCKNLIYI